MLVMFYGLEISLEIVLMRLLPNKLFWKRIKFKINNDIDHDGMERATKKVLAPLVPNKVTTRIGFLGCRNTKKVRYLWIDEKIVLHSG